MLTKEITDAVIEIARSAGAAILSIYNSPEASAGAGIQKKADESPLTAADLAAHHCIVGALAVLTPDVPVVSEEDAQSFVNRKADNRFWLIDPLDGTKEFIARNGEFTVNIALIEDGVAVWGVVYAPVLDELYCGGHAFGAFCMRRGADGLIQVSDLKTPTSRSDSVTRVVASKSHLNEETRAFIEKLGSVELVQAGSSLKFCRVAEGSADVYPRLSPTCEWDTAAAQAVVEGTGGRVCDLEGKPLRYGKPDVLNPYFVASGVARASPRQI